MCIKKSLLSLNISQKSGIASEISLSYTSSYIWRRRFARFAGDGSVLSPLELDGNFWPEVLSVSLYKEVVSFVNGNKY